MGKRTDADIGKRFEADIKAALDELQSRFPIYAHRLYDTHSARGNFLPSQPGDWIIASPTGGHLLEAKASEIYDSLRSCLSSHVEADQAAAHRLWSRTGQPSWFLFYSERTFNLELWEGLVVGECRARGKVLPREGQPGAPLTVSRNTLTDLLYNCLGLRSS